MRAATCVHRPESTRANASFALTHTIRRDQILPADFVESPMIEGIFRLFIHTRKKKIRWIN